MIREIRVFNGGFCRQLLAFADSKSLRLARFNAVFLAALHPDHGWIAIDTGYGGRFAGATRHWPYLLYRLVTPATMAGPASETLEYAGIPAREVRHVVITHFHADHIGGLQDFPDATFHHHADAFAELTKLTPLQQVRAAFLPELVPGDFAERNNAVPSDKFQVHPDIPFPTHDLFSDGSLLLHHLPGHAPGHLGVTLRTMNGTFFYASDAFWATEQLRGARGSPGIAKWFQWDRCAYVETIARLAGVLEGKRYIPVACHDGKTQAYVGRVIY